MSEDIIKESCYDEVVRGLSKDGIVHFRMNSNDRVILDTQTYEALLSLVDRSMSDFIDVGIRAIDEGRFLPAHQAIDEIRKRYAL